MVWDPPKQIVNIKRMIIYSFIPFLSIYVGWRIQKFWVLLGINILIGIAEIALQMIFPWPYYLLVIIPIEISISIYIVRHYAKKYNEKIIGDVSN